VEGRNRPRPQTGEIGLVPPITALEYLPRINKASGPPGAKTSVHSRRPAKRGRKA
jgi:hypothetical protein